LPSTPFCVCPDGNSDERACLTAHAEHEYTGECVANGHRAATHVRVSITPDGGLSRKRIYGRPATVAGEYDAPRGSSEL